MALSVDSIKGREINTVRDSVTNELSGAVDKALDNMMINAEKTCNQLAKQNNMFEFLTKGGGLGKIMDGVKDFFSTSLAESLENSPLRRMAEDILAENINKYSRTLSQNLLSIIPSKFTHTLKDIRSLAFNSVYGSITMQNNMALYFTAKVAEEAIKAIRDKRHSLICMKDSTIRLHNSLLMMTGGGPFFDKYLEELKHALEHLINAQNKLTTVQANYNINDVFLTRQFLEAKENLDLAYELILPPKEEAPTKPDASFLDKLLDGVVEFPNYKQQVTTLLQVPKFSSELLGSYDLYALKVIKLNTILTGFMASLSGLAQLDGNSNKDLIVQNLNTAREGLLDIVSTMSGSVYGVGGNPNFIPNSALTSARAIPWAVRTKGIQIMLEAIDPLGVSAVQISNTALRSYNIAVKELSELGDIQSGTAFLRANAGREEALDVSTLVLAMAFQSNQAILSSSMLGTTKWDPKSVLALGQKLVTRIQLSIDRDQHIELILSQFLHSNAAAIGSQRRLGESLFSLLDDLGMDRASDFLKSGKFGEFFKLSGTTASYIGAAMAGLSLLQKGLKTNDEKECVARAIGTLKEEELTHKLDAEINMRTSFPKQQKKNEKACAKKRGEASRVRACASGMSPNDLYSMPIESLQGMFRGVFGSDLTDTLDSTFGEYGEAVTTGIGNLPGQASDILSKTAGIFTSSRFMASAIKNASLFANNLTAGAMDVVTDVTEGVSAVKGTVEGALGGITDGLVEGISDIGVDLGDFVGGDIGDAISGGINDSLGTVLDKTGNLGELVTEASDGILDVARVPVAQAGDALKELQYLVKSAAQIDDPFAKIKKGA